MSVSTLEPTPVLVTFRLVEEKNYINIERPLSEVAQDQKNSA